MPQPPYLVLYRRLYLFVLTFVLSVASQVGAAADVATEIAQALCGGATIKRELPVLSKRWKDGVTVDEAYHLQRMAVLECLDKRNPAGFKAGLTTVASQQKFGVQQPVAGVFLPGMILHVRSDEGAVQSERFGNGKIELELAFFLKQPRATPVTSIEELKTLIAGFAPAIELPDLYFEPSGGLSGTDIIAGNTATKKALIGETKTLAELNDVNSITVTLNHNGLIKQFVRADNVMGNQFSALLWLVNHVIKQGYTIPADVPLLTGDMGQMLPLDGGIYSAEYSGFKPLLFVVD